MLSRWAGKAELPSAPFPPLSVLLSALSPGQQAACGGLGPDAVPRLQRGCPPVPCPRVCPALPPVWAPPQPRHRGSGCPLRRDSSPGSAGLLSARRPGSPGRAASVLDARPRLLVPQCLCLHVLPKGSVEPGPPPVTWRLELVLVVGRVGVDGAHKHVDAESKDARHDHIEGHVIEADPHCGQRQGRSWVTGSVRALTVSPLGRHSTCSRSILTPITPHPFT